MCPFPVFSEVNVFDYHHHSASSVDATTPMTAICREAIRRGVTEIAFTEHVDFIPEEKNTGYFCYDTYMTCIEECRNLYGNELAVRAAVEIDYCPDFEQEIAEWLHGKNLDFVVGSVHYIRGKGNISEPRSRDYFAGRTVQEAYEEYLSLVAQSASCDLWDALGHIDLVKRYGVEIYGAFEYGLFASEIDTILQSVIRNGMALEINSSGLRQSPREAYPGNEILRRYRELGGSLLTTGSDSHDSIHTGEGIREVLKTVQGLGFESIAGYRARKPQLIPIRNLLHTAPVQP